MQEKKLRKATVLDRCTERTDLDRCASQQPKVSSDFRRAKPTVDPLYVINLTVDQLEELNCYTPSIVEILDDRAGGSQYNLRLRYNRYSNYLIVCDECGVNNPY